MKLYPQKQSDWQQEAAERGASIFFKSVASDKSNTLQWKAIPPRVRGHKLYFVFVCSKENKIQSCMGREWEVSLDRVGREDRCDKIDCVEFSKN